MSLGLAVLKTPECQKTLNDASPLTSGRSEGERCGIVLTMRSSSKALICFHFQGSSRPPRQTASTGSQFSTGAGPIQAAVSAVERLLTGGRASPRLSTAAAGAEPQETAPAQSTRSSLLRNIGSFLSRGDGRGRRDRSLSLSAVEGSYTQVSTLTCRCVVVTEVLSENLIC
jgi:hypothetical protein